METWQHPKSKKWYCIDYIVMRQRDRKHCLDVAVKRGAECNTDHQFLCAKLRIGGRFPKPQKKSNNPRRHNVSRLENVDGKKEDTRQEDGKKEDTIKSP